MHLARSTDTFLAVHYNCQRTLQDDIINVLLFAHFLKSQNNTFVSDVLLTNKLFHMWAKNKIRSMAAEWPKRLIVFLYLYI